MIPTSKAHPFELAGMGSGPFRWVGSFSIPGASLAEQNPSAYCQALKDLPRLKEGTGTCSNCGMAIMHVAIIANAGGEHYGVGMDCVLKTGEPALADKAKVAHAQLIAKHRREAANMKRENQHKAWLAKVCNDGGETNAQRLDREKLERQAEAANRLRDVLARWEFILPLLDSMAEESTFCNSIRQDIRRGVAPLGRAVTILGEIYARHSGKRHSEAYEAAIAAFNIAIANDDAPTPQEVS